MGSKILLCFLFLIAIVNSEFVDPIDEDSEAVVEDEPSDREFLSDDEILPDLEPAEPATLWPSEIYFDADPKNWPGHKKPLASESPVTSADKLKHFPEQKKFVEDYLNPRVPLQIVDPFRETKVAQWNQDHFFLTNAFAALKRFNVSSPSGELEEINLREYFSRKSWNKQLEFEIALPDFMRIDLPIPNSLQCAEIIEGLHAILRGIVSQKDHFVNGSDLNRLVCALKGSKTVHLVDVAQVRRDSNFSVEISNPPNEINFESVDFENFPALRFAKFFKIQLMPTDCLFVPATWWQFYSTSADYLEAEIGWIHKKVESPKKSCQTIEGQSLAMIRIKDEKEVELKRILTVGPLQFLFAGVGQKSFNLNQLEKFLKTDKKVLHKMVEWNDEYDEITSELFRLLDVNYDGVFSASDLDKLKSADQELFLGRFYDRIQDFGDIMNDQQADRASTAPASSGKQAISGDAAAYLEKYAADLKKMLEDAVKKTEILQKTESEKGKLEEGTKKQENVVEENNAKVGTGKESTKQPSLDDSKSSAAVNMEREVQEKVEL